MTRGKGVAVHRASCTNFRQMALRAPERVIAVGWGAARGDKPALYPVDVMVEAADRQGLLRDISDPGRYIEQITDESWTEHLRRFDRVTAGDVALRDRKLAFHLPDAPPVVSRSVVEG